MNEKVPTKAIMKQNLARDIQEHRYTNDVAIAMMHVLDKIPDEFNNVCLNMIEMGRDPSYEIDT